MHNLDHVFTYRVKYAIALVALAISMFVLGSTFVALAKLDRQIELEERV